MLTIKSFVPPSPEQWEAVVNGMRLPYKSGGKHDSHECYGTLIWPVNKCESCENCPHHQIISVNPDDENDVEDDCLFYDVEGWPAYVLGPNDYTLFMNLCKAGDASHRKLLRQLPVMLEIKAPLYWWKQMDQYKVGTVTNSESTMHTMTKHPFKLEDFSADHFNLIPKEYKWGEIIAETHLNNTVELLNQLRKKMMETQNKDYWHAINEILPQSYNQTRLWTGNLENCVSIIKNRIDHRLDEWRDLIKFLFRNLPILLKIAEALEIVWIEDGRVMYHDSRSNTDKTLCTVDEMRPRG